MVIAEYWTGLKTGERKAEKVARGHLFPRIRKTCIRLLKDENWADEVSEDIWTDFLMAYIHKVDNPEAITGYLRTVTVRRCVRLRDIRKRYESLTELPGIIDTEDNVIADIDSETIRLKLEHCIDKLKPVERDALRLRYFHGQTMEQIGRHKNVTKQYISQLLSRCCQRLKRCLGTKNEFF